MGGYMCLFVGGPFDLTRRFMQNREHKVHFYSAPKYSPVSSNAEETPTVSCTKEVYSRTYTCRDGTIVYEYEESK